jgi:ubiquitin-conjugating enzyme E2 G2
MASTATRRLAKEYRELSLHAPEGILAAPYSSSNLLEWEVVVLGPSGTPYENGVFVARMVFPADYPLAPPSMRFITSLFHPNIYPDGRVCISILHPPGEDATGYERAEERWSPVQSIEKILLSVVSMLAEPNDESPANVEAAKLFRQDPDAFNRRVLTDVCKSLNL